MKGYIFIEGEKEYEEFISTYCDLGEYGSITTPTHMGMPVFWVRDLGEFKRYMEGYFFPYMKKGGKDG